MAAHGPRLTPDQLATAARVVGETGSYERAAEAIGSDRSTVRKAMVRLASPRESTRHERAVQDGLRRGRKRLTAVVTELGDQLLNELRAGSMEPKDSANMARALALCVNSLRGLDARCDAKRQARLTREHTRAQTERLRASDGDGDGSTLTLPAFVLTERPENQTATEPPPPDGDDGDDDEPEPPEAQ